MVTNRPVQLNDHDDHEITRQIIPCGNCARISTSLIMTCIHSHDSPRNMPFTYNVNLVFTLIVLFNLMSYKISNVHCE